MARIAEIEDVLLQNGVTEERLAVYAQCLRRAGSDYCRNQHCYTTAARFPAQRWEEAVRLIRFGMETYREDRLGMNQAREMLAYVYEKAGQYGKAHMLYAKAETEGASVLWGLLRTKILADQFRFSEELAGYYDRCMAQDEFLKDFLSNRFYLLAAGLILARQAEDRVQAQKYLRELLEICTPGYTGKNGEMMRQHGWEEGLTVPSECLAWLEKEKTR